METNASFSRSVLCAFVLAASTAHISHAVAETAGTVIFAVGDAWAVAEGSKQKRAIKHGERIEDSDTLITGPSGHIHLRMVDEAFIALRPDSKLKLLEYSYRADAPTQDRARLLLEQGSARSVSGKLAQRSKERYRLNTPVAAIGVRGTDYTVITTAQQSDVDVLQGGIAMSPFNANCSAQSLGPCNGDSVVDLYANMKQHFLRLRAGDSTPDLMEGRLDTLSQPEDATSLQRLNTTDSSTQKKSSVSSQNTTASTDETITERADRDNDGVADLFDAFPEDPSEQQDNDNDGIGNNADPDDDNDGLSDVRELQLGSSPLRPDTDNDGVSDSEDTRPTLADGIVVKTDGQYRAIKESAFNALNVQSVTLTPAQHVGVTGTVNTQTMQLLNPQDSSNSITLSRSATEDGQVFWGRQGSAQAWDNKVKNQLQGKHYSQWAINGQRVADQAAEHVKDINAYNNRWDAYYKRDSFRPLVSNDILYLNDVNGLQGAQTPEKNEIVSDQLALIYELSTAEAQSAASGRGEVNVTRFDFVMHYPNNAFTAVLELSIRGKQDLVATFTGTVNESGMVFGGDKNAYLKGFFINQMNEIALIFEADQNGETYSGTVVIADSGKADPHPDPVQFENYQNSKTTDVNWGRWSNFKEIAGAHEIETQAGRQLVAHNSTFALLRNDDEVTLPTEGVVNFSMTDSEAVYRHGSYLETANIENPSLTVDFNQRTFNTELTVTSPTLHNVNIVAQGELGQDAIFRSNAEFSNSTVTGAITNDANGAAMIFERELNNGVVSGAIEWAN